MYLLAGDVGGTKTYLSLFELDGQTLREHDGQRFESRRFGGLAPMVREFLKPDTRLAAAAFGVAGPVVNGTCKATNLPWEISERELERVLDIPRVRLMNDFQAVAMGLPCLSGDQLAVLQDAPRDPTGPLALIGAGTGLGEGIAIPLGDRYHVVASEGGHADFAPRNDLEIELLRFLLGRHARVSYERVLSGPGIRTLYEFVTERGGAPRLESTVSAMQRDDPSAVVTALGLSRSDPACVAALDLFVSLYGAEAGNLALKTIPTGGLFVAGGIAPKLVEKLKEGAFMHSFLHKGRMSALLEKIPVLVVLDPKVGLFGAREAARLAALDVKRQGSEGGVLP